MFQHLMQNCLGELNLSLSYALIYLDDSVVIVYSKTEEEHLVHTQYTIVFLCIAMLERFMEHGLKLKPSKCNFFSNTEISYLGHKVSCTQRPGWNRALKV